ncbi:NBR1-Ig-like domain-containing protein [Actinomadura sp. K4S16]|uniref:NBR1-Ig-like domain-containing protein n=1 Tax=Actinomadura sp. K4S16 TaxID=1316147 RepID=UPI001EEAC76D|nr:NBR1-Ig-like domain-containing protein [Actinomadura sp. K4S16]
MRAQADAVADFAAALRELRESVGNPPFREMSGRSGAISHTTLHEATKGNRLPSWGTTAEFVKACGADPAAYRERWERANLAVRSAGVGRPAASAALPLETTEGSAASAVEPSGTSIAIEPQASGLAEGTAATVPVRRPPDEIAGGARPPAAVPRGRGPSRRARLVKIALVTAVIGAGTGAVIVYAVERGSGSGRDGPGASGNRAKAALSPADCPVHATNPAPAPPTHQGDAALFVADITLPDCTRVGAGKSVTKVWRLKNTGTVPWEGYSLRRLDLPQKADNCQTISEVPIADTRPGRVVDIRTDITTPKQPGLCYVRFKMVDGAGRVAFPGSRPVNFQVIVEGP